MCRLSVILSANSGINCGTNRVQSTQRISGCVSTRSVCTHTPDVVVVCDDQQFLDSELDTLLNPVLIVEVLSETTKNYDRGEKFERYRSIASFREYVLVAQDKIHVEQFTRQPDGTWTLAETNSIGDTLALSSISCRVPLSEIYLKVQIPTH